MTAINSANTELEEWQFYFQTNLITEPQIIQNIILEGLTSKIYEAIEYNNKFYARARYYSWGDELLISDGTSGTHC